MVVVTLAFAEVSTPPLATPPVSFMVLKVNVRAVVLGSSPVVVNVMPSMMPSTVVAVVLAANSIVSTPLAML